MKIAYPKAGVIAAALAMVMTTASAPPTAPVQAAGNAGSVRAICCKCIDGSQQKASLNSRTAPWRVATGNGAPAPVVNANPDPGWSPLAPAGWVKGASSAPGTYNYTLTIVVPRCVIGGRVSIKGQFGADNSAKLFLGTTQISQTSGGINGFKAPNFGSFSNAVPAGTHTLRLEVKNEGGPTGMILVGALITECPKSTELGATGSDPKVAVACKCDPDVAST
ncbi:hypothetical protein [Sphingomonas sp. LT1P40]|uniref:hypothetical protein n=1 Tax=Alteristakelama amylovorans TaxID=3096166 RepID=UPI002FC85150